MVQRANVQSPDLVGMLDNSWYGPRYQNFRNACRNDGGGGHREPGRQGKSNLASNARQQTVAKGPCKTPSPFPSSYQDIGRDSPDLPEKPSFSFPEATLENCNSPDPFTKWVSFAGMLMPKASSSTEAEASCLPEENGHNAESSSGSMPQYHTSDGQCSVNSVGDIHSHVSEGSLCSSPDDADADTVSLQALLKLSAPIQSSGYARSSGNTSVDSTVALQQQQQHGGALAADQDCSHLDAEGGAQVEGGGLPEWSSSLGSACAEADRLAAAEEGCGREEGNGHPIAVPAAATAAAHSHGWPNSGMVFHLSSSMPQPGVPIQAPASRQYRRIQISNSGNDLRGCADSPGIMRNPHTGHGIQNVNSGQDMWMDSLERAFLDGFETPPAEQLLSRSAHDLALLEGHAARGGNIIGLLRQGTGSNDSLNDKDCSNILSQLRHVVDSGERGRRWGLSQSEDQLLAREHSVALSGSLGSHTMRSRNHHSFSNTALAVRYGASQSMGRSYSKPNDMGHNWSNGDHKHVWEDDITVLPRIETMAQWRAGFKVHKVKLGGASPPVSDTAGNVVFQEHSPLHSPV